MEEEKRYIDSLLRNEKYLNELENMYMEMKGIRMYNTKIINFVVLCDNFCSLF